MTKTIYTQGKQVGSFNNWDELRIGANHPAFIWQGDKLVYPNPILDGLVLWFDFSGMTNSDTNRGIATDLSGNGNHGTLQNFNYTAESGYDKNKLLFDGVDDYITSENTTGWVDTGKLTVEVVLKTNFADRQHFILGKSYTSFDMALRSGYLNIWYSDGTIANYVQSPFYDTVLSDGKTHCLTVVFHKDISGVELYVDGKKYGEDYKSNSKDLTGFSNQPFEIGHRVGGRDKYVGNIYSTRIYNRPLSSSEIAHNYAIEKERFGIE